MQILKFICKKCGKEIVVETDGMSESQAVKLHVCEGRK